MEGRNIVGTSYSLHDIYCIFITVLLSPIFIPFLRKLKFGQSIREEGPKSHQKNQGRQRWAES